MGGRLQTAGAVGRGEVELLRHYPGVLTSAGNGGGRGVPVATGANDGNRVGKAGGGEEPGGVGAGQAAAGVWKRKIDAMSRQKVQSGR